MKLQEIDNQILNSAPTLTSKFSIHKDESGFEGPNGMIVPLNITGRWIIQQLDGKLAVTDILKSATEKYPDVNEEILKRDIVDFIYDLYQWGYLDNVGLPKPSGYFRPEIRMVDKVEGRSGCGMCKESYI